MSPAQTVAWAGAARRWVGRRFGARQLSRPGDPFISPPVSSRKAFSERPMASVDLVRPAGPRPSLPRAGSRSPAKPYRAGPAQPRRRPQPRPAALSAQGWVSHAGEGGEPGGWSRPFEAKRRFGSAVCADQPGPRAVLRFRGDYRSPGLGAPESPGPGRGKELGTRQARDDECRSGLGQWVSAGPAGPRPASPPAQSGPRSPNEPRCAPSPAPSPLLAAG